MELSQLWGITAEKGGLMTTREDNERVLREEIQRSKKIMQKNRHSMLDGKWFGPNPEPNSPGKDCGCSGCEASEWLKRQSRDEEKAQVIKYRFPQGVMGENYRMTEGVTIQLAPNAVLKDGDKEVGKLLSATVEDDGIHVEVQITDKNVWDSIMDDGTFSIRGN